MTDDIIKGIKIENFTQDSFVCASSGKIQLEIPETLLQTQQPTSLLDQQKQQQQQQQQQQKQQQQQQEQIQHPSEKQNHLQNPQQSQSQQSQPHPNHYQHQNSYINEAFPTQDETDIKIIKKTDSLENSKKIQKNDHPKNKKWSHKKSNGSVSKGSKSRKINHVNDSSNINTSCLPFKTINCEREKDVAGKACYGSFNDDISSVNIVHHESNIDENNVEGIHNIVKNNGRPSKEDDKNDDGEDNKNDAGEDDKNDDGEDDKNDDGEDEDGEKNCCNKIFSTIKDPSPSTVAKIVFVLNLGLLTAKIVAAIFSGSLAVISAVIDSAIDLVSGALLYLSSRAIKRSDPLKYPKGRARLEPASIIVLAVLMAIVSIQVIVNSISHLLIYSNYDLNCHVKNDLPNTTYSGTVSELGDVLGPCLDGRDGPNMNLTTILICFSTIVLKLLMCVYMYRMKSAVVKALALDQRNDVISNSAALIFGYMGDKISKYFDPVGAILISLYIIITWIFAASEQLKILSGHSASDELLQSLTTHVTDHHPEIRSVSHISVTHQTSDDFEVEVEICLPSTLTLKQSRDITKSLKVNLEKVDEVKVAVVTCDFVSDEEV